LVVANTLTVVATRGHLSSSVTDRLVVL
jgi:hypothetical protein